MKDPIRCIRSGDFYELRQHQITPTYKYEHVNVFYGFDNYSDTMDNLHALMEVIRSELPEINLEDMHVRFIERHESDRHAHQTMVLVSVETEKVVNNLHLYNIL